MARFMLDTAICSYLMKRSNQAVLDRAVSVPLSEICTSSIVRSELEFGVAVSPKPEKDRAALDGLLLGVAALDYPSEAAAEYGRIRAFLESHGTPIGANDMLIAAHALSLRMTLVTNNIREFQRVPGLKIENWAAPAA